MRKKRIFIFDDDPVVLAMLCEFFRSKEYETISYLEPRSCPVYLGQSERCDNLRPCGDILITDYHLPHMSGLDMILLQEQRGCKTDIRNKAVISGFFSDRSISIMKEHGIPFFRKPFKLSDIGLWLKECDTRIDLTQSLGMKRKSSRSSVNIDVSFLAGKYIQPFHGRIANISPDGMKLCTEHELKENEIVRFETMLPNLCLEAQVRWTSGRNGSSYSAGLLCSLHRSP